MTSVLQLFGVPALTPWTEVWLVGVVLVFAAEVTVLVRIWHRERMLCFKIYLLAMLFFPMSFTRGWNLSAELITDGWALAAAIEAMVRLTSRLRAERRDVQKAIAFTALAIALWAAARRPLPFPEWPQAQYFVRLYSHIGAISLLAVALGYSVREKAERLYQAHAAILLGWFCVWFLSDRWFYPKWPEAGWYGHGLVIMAGLLGCLTAWFLTLRVTRTECLSEYASAHQP